MNWNISDNKIKNYILEPNHPGNSGKAKFFFGIGFSKSNVTQFKSALAQYTQTATLIKNDRNKWGDPVCLSLQHYCT